ncbi:hypothetical protein SSX86_002843 [Deinandra increscens subsp. villosa]|uniref:Uncharacterized protein n=1 Tax=Deinandra increscens subsp. villosa TaxID=3103831 RepID=A0AAP0DT34_9ASTR
MLFYMGTVSFYVVPDVIKVRRVPGSVYRSPVLYAKLRHEMDHDNSSSDAVSGYRSFCPNFVWILMLRRPPRYPSSMVVNGYRH